MAAKIYFRSSEDMPEIETTALDFCRGKVLDVGAGAGSHALLLKEKGLETSALDIDPLCVAVMKERGLEEVICADFLKFESQQPFDTLLFLMNGIGVAGNLRDLKRYLNHAYTLTSQEGQVILDSSDLRISNPQLENDRAYFGEIRYQLSFEKTIGSPYYWLYVDFETLAEIALQTGWKAEMIYETDDGQYLARLVKG